MSSPSIPKPPPPPPPPPTIDQATAAADKADYLRKRQGASATLLTSPQGALAPQTASAKLLG